MDKHCSTPICFLESDVSAAQAGNREALENVMSAIQNDVYGLALRFCWHPQDAEDATQEILIKVMTNLGSFRGDSGFKTWVYRIASNTLLTMKKKRMEQQAMTFDAFADDLCSGQTSHPCLSTYNTEESLLLEEVKIGCTQAMLLCLDRKHRLAYILGEIIGIDHGEAAAVMEIMPATYRKQLSRSRQSIFQFMKSHCGLVNPGNSCRCAKRVDVAIGLGRIDPENLKFARSISHAKVFPQVLEEIRRLEFARRVAALYRSHPEPVPSQRLGDWLRWLVQRVKTSGVSPSFDDYTQIEKKC